MPDVAVSRVPWAIVVPIKRVTVAKSRLQVPADIRAALALSMALDTVAAALSCSGVRTVIAVNDDADVSAQLRSLGAQVVRDEPDAGLNSALVHGASVAVETQPGCGVAALSADLPALRADELTAVLAAAADQPTAVVADAVGTGTTLLTAAAGRSLLPAFGPDSRVAHVDAGAADLTEIAGPSLRRDVDTLDDLRAAAALGCGPATTEQLTRHSQVLDGP
jgi:2-phospho-L-lactate guanylyltransferase